MEDLVVHFREEVPEPLLNSVTHGLRMGQFPVAIYSPTSETDEGNALVPGTPESNTITNKANTRSQLPPTNPSFRTNMIHSHITSPSGPTRSLSQLCPSSRLHDLQHQFGLLHPWFRMSIASFMTFELMVKNQPSLYRTHCVLSSRNTSPQKLKATGSSSFPFCQSLKDCGTQSFGRLGVTIAVGLAIESTRS
ncbi:hypothetical protein LB505_003441 [Fusarium chuoi]|nr:hypothetical protein LB505_003441 [Fusarium chuoi]